MTHGSLPRLPPSGRRGLEMTEQALPVLPPAPGKAMTKEQFKAWLKSIDRDENGMISRHELREILQSLGISCTGLKAWRAFAHADLNRNKFVEGDQEIEELIKYAGKRWGIVVI